MKRLCLRRRLGARLDRSDVSDAGGRGTRGELGRTGGGDRIMASRRRGDRRWGVEMLLPLRNSLGVPFHRKDGGRVPGRPGRKALGAPIL